MKRFVCSVVSCLAVAACVVCAANPVDPIISLNEYYKKCLDKIASDSFASYCEWANNYKQALKDYQTSRQKDGDLDGWRTGKNELDRFLRNKTVDKSDLDAVDSALRSLQKTHLQSKAALSKDKNTKIVELTEKYTAHLLSKQRRSTKSGNMEQAIVFNEEIKRVESEEQYTAAKAALTQDVAKKDLAEAEEEIATAISPSVMPDCPTCTGKGKIPEPCRHCNGTGNCKLCQGKGKKPSGLRGGTSLAMCVPCKGTGRCKTCRGSKTTGRGITCTRCAGKGRIIVTRYSSSSAYTPDALTMSLFSNVNTLVATQIPIRDAIRDYTSYVGKILVADGHIIRSSGSHYIYAQDIPIVGQSSPQLSFIPVDSTVREAAMAAIPQTRRPEVVGIKYTIQSNRRRFLLAVTKNRSTPKLDRPRR